MLQKLLPLAIIVAIIGGVVVLFQKTDIPTPQQVLENIEEGGPGSLVNHPLSIDYLRAIETPGSDLVIEQTLNPESNYGRYIASYQSDGLKIYGLLTIPRGQMPEGGWPAIIFNHGYIPPSEYRTTERYLAYTDAFSRNGYVLFRPDYRGHGDSEGEPAGAYGSNGYTIDVLNALESVQKLEEVNPEKIGMWGHSMGGFITLRSMVSREDIKAGVIWAGVVGSYPDLLTNWRRRSPDPSPASPTPSPTGSRRWRQLLEEQLGSFDLNSEVWKPLSANNYLADISGPVQLHHGTNDTSVPVEFSQTLEQQLQAAGKKVELFVYPGDDHNISTNFSAAMQRSVAFFDEYLK